MGLDRLGTILWFIALVSLFDLLFTIWVWIEITKLGKDILRTNKEKKKTIERRDEYSDSYLKREFGE